MTPGRTLGSMGSAAAAMCSSLLMTLACGSGCASGTHDDPPPEPNGFEMPTASAISWESAHQENGKTVISGTTRAEFGTFELLWAIDSQGKPRLLTREPAGSAELPLREKELWPLVLEGGVTAVFQEWYPLANVNAPTTIRMIVTVATKELFSVLAEGAAPPKERLARELVALRWGGVTDGEGVRRVQGRAGENAGGFELLWERQPGRLPALVGVAASMSGNREPLASRLVPWVDEQAGNTMILQQVPSPESGGTPPHLIPLFAVNTKELMRGFELAR